MYRPTISLVFTRARSRFVDLSGQQGPAAPQPTAELDLEADTVLSHTLVNGLIFQAIQKWSGPLVSASVVPQPIT